MITDENLLLELCRHIVASGKGLGATAVEVHASSGTSVEANIELSQVSGVNRTLSNGVAVRVYVGSKMGCAFTNMATKRAGEEAVGLAFNAARATTEDSEWVGLPRPTGYPVVHGLWEDSTAQCEPASVVSYAKELMDRVKEREPKLIPAYGGSGVQVQRSAYANSNGIGHAERGTIAYVGLQAIAQTETGVTPGVGHYDIRRGLGFDFDAAVEDIVSTVRVCIKSVEGESGKSTVIMHPDAYNQLFQFTLFQSIRGDNVARGKSMIADRLGDSIAWEGLTVVDDGTFIKGVNASVADDEGVPRRRTPLIEKGVLRSFIWDTYWANRMGVESTGNASRNMRQGLVEITPSNVVVEPGRRQIADIVSEVDRGYLIRDVQGAHSSNPESGDFSVVGNPAILIEDGEMKGIVPGLMVAGNVFTLLENAVEVARTPQVVFGLIGPEVVFQDVSVIARGQ